MYLNWESLRYGRVSPSMVLKELTNGKIYVSGSAKYNEYNFKQKI